MAKRTEYYKIRLTKLEKKLLEKSAQNAGMQTAPFIRESALGNKISYKLTQEEVEILQTLTVFHTNFKRMSNSWKNQDSELFQDVAQTAAAIREVLNKLR